MKRRTEITIETERVVVCSGFERAEDRQWCERCGRDSRLIAPDAAAALLGVTTQVIVLWAEAAGLHFVRAGDGFPLLCLHSVPPSCTSTRAPVEMSTEDGKSFRPEA